MSLKRGIFAVTRSPLTRLVLVRLALALIGLGLLAAPAAAETPPMGSYMQSCQDVRMTAGWLKANCRDNSGRWVESTTVPSWCSTGEIVNDNGRLTCRPRSAPTGTTGYSGERVPTGTYMGTCRNISVFAGWLKASCQDRNGRWVDSTISPGWCVGRDITNSDGRLSCH